jgi:hypothetical protein
VDAWLIRYQNHFRSGIYSFVFGMIARLVTSSYAVSQEPPTKSTPR